MELSELTFLCQVFQKSHVKAGVIDQAELANLLKEAHSVDFFQSRAFFSELIPTVRPYTVYCLTDSFSFSYRLLLLPDMSEPTVFYVGPYLEETPSEQTVLELGERNGISPQKQRFFSEYYTSIPTLPPASPIWIMFHTFCERIWKSHPFTVKEITQSFDPSKPLDHYTLQDADPSDVLVKMEAIERRYAFENEIIHAVAMGRTYMESQLRSAFSAHFLEKRTSNLLRNSQNYMVIMNTLLRKAAEQGGVHPMHIDKLSSAFAERIENMPAVSETSSLMCEMFRSYCKMVSEHSMQHLSPVVQRTLLIIDEDLSADLSTGMIAEAQGISTGYLSARFKKEMGKTLSEYICERRMEYAARLLRTTSLQIQTVALHVGMMDLQYFSKVFKKHHKMTPSAYRTQQKSFLRTEG